MQNKPQACFTTQRKMVVPMRTCTLAVALCAAELLCGFAPPNAWAQATPGTPRGPDATPQTGKPRTGGGFGFSLDLGSLIKAVQSLGDDKYASPDTSKQPQYEPRQLILSWQSAQQTQAQALLAAAAGGRVLGLADLPNLELNIAVLSFDTDAQAAQALTLFQAATPPITADRHAIAYPMQSAPVTSTSKGKQYAHDLLKVQSKTSVQAPVVLGVIDTEVGNPEALGTASYKARRIFADTDKPAPADHGTGVASIMAAKNSDSGFQGLAQGTHLRSANVMREVTPGINASNTMLVAQALDWLVGEKAQVINLSLGAANDAVLAAVVAKTTSLGVVLVAAAGNGGADAPPSYPAAYPGVVAVTAVDAKKQLYTRANRGKYVTIAAPGVDVWVPVGNGKYMSGTSFAAPFVTAAIAQKMAQNPQPKTPQSAQALIKSLCDSALPLGTTNPSPEFGCGLMQL